MREILFKAKRKDNGEWVEGYVMFCNGEINPGQAYIVPVVSSIIALEDWVWLRLGPFVEVDSETICQYTGLTDKNGNKIFGGDIISIINSNRQGLPAPVHYFYDQCMFAIHRSGYNLIWMSEYDAEHYFEIIGNIHDGEEKQ